MRTQYHLLPSGNDFDAWDVERLIQLSAQLPVREVLLESLTEIDSTYWYQDHAQRPTVRSIAEHLRLILDVETRYPIIQAADGRVMDGMHRIARALLDHRKTIAAVRFDVDPEPDFRDCRPQELPYPKL